MMKLSILVLFYIVLVDTTNITQLHLNGSVSELSDLPLINSTKDQIVQSQEIYRSVDKPPTNTTGLNDTTIIKNRTNILSDFRPSPYFESYYEFNRFPVVPALPESKQISKNFDSSDEKLEEQFTVKWPTTTTTSTTTDQPWRTKMKFPIHQYEEPYPFYSGIGNDYLKPSIEKPEINNLYNWGKYERRRPISGKNQFDFTAHVDVPRHKIHEYNTGEIEHKTTYDPWKKIIKFLTTILPIGLLISALTPTVITVTPINGTQTRSRADDSTLQQNTKTIISSLDYFAQLNRNNGCEDRVFCELLVSASTSKNAEYHIDNLLNRLAEDEKTVERVDEIKKIFESVRKQDCRPIICKKIKPT